MKKYIIAFLIITSFATVANASEVSGCTNERMSNYNSEATLDDGSCIPYMNQAPKRVMQPWKLTGYQTPTVTRGTVVSDRMGITDKCNYFHGCFDLTGTEWYENQMRFVARELIRINRAKFFPMFRGWIELVK